MKFRMLFSAVLIDFPNSKVCLKWPFMHLVYQTIKVLGLSEVLIWFRDGAFKVGSWDRTNISQENVLTTIMAKCQFINGASNKQQWTNITFFLIFL